VVVAVVVGCDFAVVVAIHKTLGQVRARRPRGGVAELVHKQAAALAAVVLAGPLAVVANVRLGLFQQIVPVVAVNSHQLVHGCLVHDLDQLRLKEQLANGLGRLRVALERGGGTAAVAATAGHAQVLNLLQNGLQAGVASQAQTLLQGLAAWIGRSS